MLEVWVMAMAFATEDKPAVSAMAFISALRIVRPIIMGLRRWDRAQEQRRMEKVIRERNERNAQGAPQQMVLRFNPNTNCLLYTSPSPRDRG